MRTEISKEEYEYFFSRNKFIRDLVHGYVYLTEFELTIIDTKEFQRLKDIRQLTSQQVYPGARHTRFEHSLGVLEMTRQAIQHLNTNGVLYTKETEIIGRKLQFNATLAALLHDVGHCPFSHLGENEFDKSEVRNMLYDVVSEKLPDTELCLELLEDKNDREKDLGARHEQISCIMILERFYSILSNVTVMTNGALIVDFELIIRSIIGLTYKVDSQLLSDSPERVRDNQIKNLIISLINSNVFDMDKLDYIMRDSFMTGIGTPVIDTQRLFRNMYLDRFYSIIFTSKAIPTLQNIIDARDSLYMYVYNHHAVVFSDFIQTYIFRRLAHNERDYYQMITTIYRNYKEGELIDESLFEDYFCEPKPISVLGMMNKNYLFSPGSILYENRSDSDLISLLNVVYHSIYYMGCDTSNTDDLKSTIIGEINTSLRGKGIVIENLSELIISNSNNSKLIESYADKILRVYQLINSYLRRSYLKPWWKTYSEFNSFIQRNYPDDKIRRNVCKWICQSDIQSPAGDEFRSQIAKHVNFIVNKIWNELKSHEKRMNQERKAVLAKLKTLGLLEPIKDGGFFVIQRSARFFEPEIVRKLNIAQKANEMIGEPNEVKYKIDEYYIKELTNVIPQRDYYSIYARDSFYVFSERLSKDKNYSPEDIRKHYRLIEKIFVFVTTYFVSNGVEVFQVDFSNNENEKEEQSKEKMFEAFVGSIL